MRRFALRMLVLLVSVIYTVAQVNLAHLMTERSLSCKDIVINCERLFKKYYNDNKNDSIEMVLEYWNENCFFGEAYFRVGTIFDIKNRSFDEKIS